MVELKKLPVDGNKALTRLFKGLLTLFTKETYSWANFKSTLLKKKGEEF